jgi:proline dehydrogenase
MKKDLIIKNLERAFNYKNNFQLRRTYYVFKILQSPKLVSLLTSFSKGIIKYNLPFKYFIKQTVFKVFCAGETIEEAFNTIETLKDYNVKSVLDYVSEGEKNEKSFILNATIITNNIIKIGREAPGNYISVKLSGLEDPDFFKSINNSIFPKTINESQKFEVFIKRLDLICKTAYENNVIIYIDAEDRYMQDVFDDVVEHMMKKYNKISAVIFNTVQMYLNDRLEYIDYLISNGQEEKYIPGIKLVRGAYVEKERITAIVNNKQSPVYDSKQETDDAFNLAIEKCLSQYKYVDTCIATHNDKSTLLAINCIKKYNIINSEYKVRFSQLYGMSDHLTFNLATNGFNTSKYLPYGEVKKAIPYLIRRSEENSSINGQIIDEVVRLKEELSRRCVI